MEHSNSATQLVEAVAVTAELTGSELSEAAIRAIVQDLSGYPQEQVFKALRKCRRELTGKLTLAQIISRIDGGHPSADEAWAQVSTDDEGRTLVVTKQAMAAMEDARHLLADGDRVGARMAFKKRYEETLDRCRDRNEPPDWFVSLGSDRNSRAEVIADALAAGKITADHSYAPIALEGPYTPTPMLADLANNLRITHDDKPNPTSSGRLR
jgi:hypothetical protein